MSESPEHKFVVPVLFKVTAGNRVTKIVCEAVSEPQLFVAVTTYVPAVETGIAAVIPPVFQEYVLPPVAARVTELPVQIVVLPLAVIAATGAGFTVSDKVLKIVSLHGVTTPNEMG